MNTADFKPGEMVRYIPYHAKGDRGHPDCEDGIVSSTNDWFVFVQYKLGGPGIATKTDQLVKTLT